MLGFQITRNVVVLLQAFLADVHEQRYGFELMKITGFPSGKLYPMLAKLEAAGWLDSEMEDVDSSAVGRPPRRWYRLSERGTAAARHEVAVLHQQTAPVPTRACGQLRPQGGGA
ncbi:MAG TPA: helix-turn-helix transcriptional regulator [Rugosimonospora sp.]|nr:helix-turn-helix transcriptional regulator [Rugosimonospora sp.]